jgi:hypothetical protein
VPLVSNSPIPGLAASDDNPPESLRITLGSAPDWNAAPPRDARADGPRLAELDGDRALLDYADGTCFHLDFARRRIWASWPAPLTLEDAATYLLGPVLGYWLRREGGLCLHASSAIVGGRCMAFVGGAGSGKSTLAAALAMQGDAILSEDVTCVIPDAAGFSVQPGYPRIRLWADSAGLVAGLEELPLLTPNWDKRFLPLNGGRCRFHERAEPLAGLFLLTARRAMDAPAAVAGLDGQEILSRLVANTYGNRLPLARARQHREFAGLGTLGRAVPVRALTLNADGARLFEACDWIRRHALA